jgi:hypothetical protein
MRDCCAAGIFPSPHPIRPGCRELSSRLEAPFAAVFEGRITYAVRRAKGGTQPDGHCAPSRRDFETPPSQPYSRDKRRTSIVRVSTVTEISKLPVWTISTMLRGRGDRVRPARPPHAVVDAGAAASADCPSRSVPRHNSSTRKVRPALVSRT